MTSVTKRAAAAAGLLLPLAFCVSCGETEIDSTWAARPPAIDGSTSEWQGGLFYFERPPAFVGVRNDGEYLYLCMTTPDATIAREAFRRGLRLRIAPAGGDPLEIRFPLPLEVSGPPERWDREGGRGLQGEGDGRRPEGSPPRERPEPGGRFDIAPGMVEAFEVVPPGSKDAQRVPAENLLGIEPRIGTEENTLVYELRVPLHSRDRSPYAVNAAPGSRLRVEVEEGPETRSMGPPVGMRGDAEEGEMGGRGRPGVGGAGMGGTGMPAPGMGGGSFEGGRGGPEGPGGEGRTQGSDLKLKLTVLLASSPGAAGAAASSRDTSGAPVPSPK
jgi:hypothetical protein